MMEAGIFVETLERVAFGARCMYQISDLICRSVLSQFQAGVASHLLCGPQSIERVALS